MRSKWRLSKDVFGRKRDRIEKAEDDSDPEYLAWVRMQRCAVSAFPFPGATPCRGGIEAHHPTGAGLALKAPDREAFALCHVHHVEELHGHSGAFKAWPKSRLKAWQLEISERYQAFHVKRQVGLSQ